MPSTVIGLLQGVGDVLVEVDDAFLSIVDYSRGEFESTAKRWRAITPPECHRLDEAGIEQAMRTGNGGFTRPYRKDLLRQDGSRVPVLVCCALLADGAPGAWMGAVVDLSVLPFRHAEPHDTEVLRRAVEPSALHSRLIGELVRERSRLHAMVDNTSSMMWSVDRALHLMTANAAFQRQISLAIGRTLGIGETVIAPEYPVEVATEWQRWYGEALSGTALEMQTSYVSSGGLITFEHVLTPYRDSTGAVIGVSAVSHDVSGRAQAERHAMECKLELQEALRLALVGSWHWDSITDTVIWSDSMCELFGWPPGAPPPAFVEHAQFYTATSWDDLFRAVGAAVETGAPFELELELCTDAAPRWILSRGVPKLGAEGQLVGIHGIAMDVTARHEADETRRNLELQLQQSQKMQELGQLAGGVAHDFNNILTTILLQLGTIREEVTDAPLLAASIEEIDSSTRRASALTKQLLMFSRRHAPELRVIEINGVLHEFLRMMRRLIGEQYPIDFQASPEPLLVHGDRGMIEQVIMNLAVNARDAMALGGHVVIRTATVDIQPGRVPRWPGARAGAFMEITVTDTGCGIPLEHQARIFEPFFTTKQEGRGTGLGLATTFGIVAQHGGWVEFTSTPSSGTTFRVRLPIHARVLTPKANDAVSLGELRSGSTRRGRVLLVEDEASVRTLVERALTDRQYQVVAAADAAHARRCWDAQPNFDLVLSDMVLPGTTTGIDLIRMFRKQRPSLRSLLMTGYSQEMGSPDFLTRAGGNVLQKPFDIPQLLQAIEGVMERAPTAMTG